MATSKPNKTHYDLVIVGGSTAGMAAAMSAARARVSILLIDSGEPRNRFAHHLHNFLGQDGKQPLQWIEIARENLSQYHDVVERLTGRVTDIEKLPETKDDYLFQLVIDNLNSIHARRIILATGIQDYIEGFPKGVQELWGSVVQNCPFCAGYEHTDRSWAIILSPSSVFPHLMMGSMFTYFNFKHPLHIFTNGHKELVGEVERAAYKANGVIIIDDQVTQVTAEGKAELEQGGVIHLEGGKTLSFSQIYIKPSFKLSPLTTKLNLATNPVFKTVNVDMFGATNVSGIFAAGDIAQPQLQGLSIANAQGAAAGAGVVLSLTQAKWGAACAAAGVVLPAPGAPAAASGAAAKYMDMG